MKKLILALAASALFSCSVKEKNADANMLENLSYTVDTVLIETGEELLFLQSDLSHSILSNDQARLYNFTPKDELEEIDLDRLSLLRKITTVREGPRGTGLPYALQFDVDGRWVLFGYNEVRIFSPDLDSMQRYPITEEDLIRIKPGMLAPFNPKVVDQGVLYAIYETYEQVPQGLAIVSLEDRIAKKIPLEIADRIVPFTYSLFVQGRLSNKSYEPISLMLVDNELIVSTAFTNEAIIIDLASDSVRVKTFHSSLTQDKRPLPDLTSAETINELQDLIREGDKGVKFGPFYFDRENSQFWRFSRELDREIGDSLIFKNVLTVFDEDLNQQGEMVVPVDPFSKKFFKDGKLWSYVNVDDELGFAVMDFKF
ncbi:DUF4221 family protein [Algoriphagus aestuariicola]|uniref:DUF4221 family protein n=1 Tax=Algoriphagus aestuariicola TaxID=1852016 RepID=A0ABS3BSN1_9BACT|nr:DUF4221 family protein [Algoriphagus aestuariicola]MBN7802317.1 DUF4221 family protein [Algoriphagus aestuariicola]